MCADGCVDVCASNPILNPHIPQHNVSKHNTTPQNIQHNTTHESTSQTHIKSHIKSKLPQRFIHPISIQQTKGEMCDLCWPQIPTTPNKNNKIHENANHTQPHLPKHNTSTQHTTSPKISHITQHTFFNVGSAPCSNSINTNSASPQNAAK